MQPFDVAARLLLATLAWSSLVTAGTVQDSFVFPALPNRADKLELGRGYSITWRPELLGSFATFCPNCTVTKVDLWVAAATGTTNFEHRIASGLDINATNSYIWTCDIPESELVVQADWNFRFLPNSQTPETTSQEISSPMCLIIDPSTASSTTTTAKSTTTISPAVMATTTSTGLSSAAVTVAASEATDSSTPGTAATQSTGLSTAAAVGVGVGATVGAVALVGLGFVALHRLTRHPQAVLLYGNPRDGGMSIHPKAPLSYNQHPTAFGAHVYPVAPPWQMPYAAGNAPLSELSGASQNSVAELGTHR